MIPITSFSIRFIAVAGFVVLLSSCAVTTKSTEGSSETFQNTSEASTKFTSSTSPREEGQKDSSQNVKQFAAINLDRLREDMARGNGEHLTAFAHLLGIKESHQTEFFALTKRDYPVLFSAEPANSDDMLARLNTELTAYPTWRQ